MDIHLACRSLAHPRTPFAHPLHTLLQIFKMALELLKINLHTLAHSFLHNNVGAHTQEVKSIRNVLRVCMGVLIKKPSVLRALISVLLTNSHLSMDLLSMIACPVEIEA